RTNPEHAPDTGDVSGRAQAQDPIVLLEGLIERVLTLQNQGVGLEPVVGAKALIDSDPCVGRPDCLVSRHIATPSIIRCADAVWVLARLEHLELRQVLRYGFPRAVRHFAIALQALKSSRSGSGV